MRLFHKVGLTLVICFYHISFSMSQNLNDFICDISDSLINVQLYNRDFISSNKTRLLSIDTIDGFEIDYYLLTKKDECLQSKFFIKDLNYLKKSKKLEEAFSRCDSSEFSYLVFFGLGLLASDYSSSTNDIRNLYSKKDNIYNLKNNDNYYQISEMEYMQVWKIRAIVYSFGGPTFYYKYFQMFSDRDIDISCKKDVFLQYIYKQVLSRETVTEKELLHKQQVSKPDFKCSCCIYD